MQTIKLTDWNKKPTKIIIEYPDTLEMKDNNGVLHTYSITELLDGLAAFAKEQKENQ